MAEVLPDLNHALARSMGGGGGGACLGVIGFLGKGFVGLIGHIFSALVRKTWYLNYALYGLFRRLFHSFALRLTSFGEAGRGHPTRAR